MTYKAKYCLISTDLNLLWFTITISDTFSEIFTYEITDL